MAVLGAWFVGQQCSRLAARLPAWCASERGGGGGKLGGGERPRQRVRPSHALGPSCRSVPAAPDLRSSPKWRLTGVR
jgi:hypothetical protein